MAEYIDRQAAIDMFQNLAYDDWNQGAITTWAAAFSEAAEMTRNLPAADVVGVVRCKDCKHRPVEKGEYRLLEFPDEVCPCQEMDADYADWYGQMLTDDWFCANGEKKNES